MADQVIAKDEGAKFLPHPEGQFVGVCVDVINLGVRPETYLGKDKGLTPKCSLVFMTDQKNPQTGAMHTISAEFTVSMGEKSGLRLLLEAWRGKSYTEEQAKAGVPVDKLVGVAALMSVEHKTSGKGRTYAKIKTISPLPKGLPIPEVSGYKREEFWQQRKDEYAAEAKRYRETMHAGHDDFPEPQDPGEDIDDLPF